MYSLRCVSLLSACKTGFRKWTEKIKISLLTRELSDYRGLDVTSESEGAVMALDDAILELTGMRSSCFETVTKATALDENFALAHCFTANLLLTSMGVNEHDPIVCSILQKLENIGKEVNLTRRERLHVCATKALSQRQFHLATHVWESILLDYPHDLMSIRHAHDVYYFLGEFAKMKNSIHHIYPKWSASMPGYNYVIGMESFAYSECGDYENARNRGKIALELDNTDAWALHALVHVAEAQCDHREGIQILKDYRDDFVKGDIMNIHIYWHWILFAIEQGRQELAFDLYDYRIREEKSSVLFNLADAASALWRFDLMQWDVGNRWEELGDLIIKYKDIHMSPFLDAHIMMILSSCNRNNDVKAFLDSLKQHANENQPKKECIDLVNDASYLIGEEYFDIKKDIKRLSMQDSVQITKKIGYQLIEGILAFRQNRFADCLDLLLPIRYDLQKIGGSLPQRDLFHQTLLAAAISSDKKKMAEYLCQERLHYRVSSGVSWNWYASLLYSVGDMQGVMHAKENANIQGFGQFGHFGKGWT